MSFPTVDRIRLAKAQEISETEGRTQVTIRVKGKEYTYAVKLKKNARIQLWMVHHRS